VSTLRGLGYRLAQGYHFARPVPAEEFAAMLGRRLGAVLDVVPAE
jgi:EAL domain-containing protein (putative c-di-GMP-specific phosphodiesterase class I)